MFYIYRAVCPGGQLVLGINIRGVFYPGGTIYPDVTFLRGYLLRVTRKSAVLYHNIIRMKK